MFDAKPIRLIGMSGSLRTGSYSNAVLATLRETFAGRENIHVVYNDDPNPQTPEDDPDHFWEIWYESLLKHTPEGPPDYVFASETQP